MANFSISNISVAGISACVPEKKINNLEHKRISKEDIEKFILATGVESRRIADDDKCASDYAVIAANKLIKDLNWDKDEISILIFVSQTADYRLPVTAAILQDRLGLSKSCIAFDIPLGCSGYVYGLSVIAALMNATKLTKGILLVGDTISKLVSPFDKSTEPLFGDALTATALEYNEQAGEMSFNLGTDGSGFGSIIIPSGGMRNPAAEESFIYKEVEQGISRNPSQLILDGMDVFTFGISQAPKSVNELLNFADITIDDVDHFIFHQANLFMNEKIRKKLKLDESKVPYSIREFGNTNGASIPLTIVTRLKNKLAGEKRIVLCGFGVGLSWGTVSIKTNNIHISDLVEA